MLKNIFLPEALGSYYIGSTRIIAFEIRKTTVYATLVIRKGYQRIVQKTVHEQISMDTTLELSQRISTAISTILNSMGAYNYIYVALPSNYIIFKEMSFPFAGYQKIKAVLRYELEPLLPFSVDESVVDFIITKERATQTDILAVAVKRDLLQEHIAPFLQVGVSPEKITVDLFELFGFYQQFYTEKQTQGTALIDLGFYTTRIAYSTDDQLVAIRSLNRGLISPSSTTEVIENLIRFGIEDLDQASSAYIDSLLSEIQFTLRTVAMRTGTNLLQEILILGEGAQIKGINNRLQLLLNTSVKKFALARQISHKKIQVQVLHEPPPESFISLATAVGSKLTESINLVEHDETTDQLLKQQLITAASLLSACLLATGLFIFINLRSLRTELAASEAQSLEKLKKTFKIPPERKRLPDVIDAARAEVAREEAIWFALSQSNRFSFLKLLQDLSTRIDREGVGLQLKRLYMTNEAIILEGSVRDFNALITLRQELERSPLFTIETPPQSIDFTAKPIRLIIKKEEEI